MILLRVVSGGLAGTVRAVRRFPFRVGRASSADWRIEAPGVWDQHFVITSSPVEGFSLDANPEGLTLVNGRRASCVVLRNGDCIECGELRLQFWLGPAQQRGLRARETMIWFALAGLVALELVLCWWLTA